jgi:hypothetical protein
MPHDLMTRCEQKKEYRITGEDSWKWVEVAASDMPVFPVKEFAVCTVMARCDCTNSR